MNPRFLILERNMVIDEEAQEELRRFLHVFRSMYGLRFLQGME